MPAGKTQSLIGSPGELPPSPFGGMQTRSGKKMWGAAKAKVQAVQAMEGKGSLLAARKLAAETSAAKKAELKAELARENAAMKKRLQAMNIGRDAKALDPEVEEARRRVAEEKARAKAEKEAKVARENAAMKAKLASTGAKSEHFLT